MWLCKNVQCLVHTICIIIKLNKVPTRPAIWFLPWSLRSLYSYSKSYQNIQIQDVVQWLKTLPCSPGKVYLLLAMEGGMGVSKDPPPLVVFSIGVVERASGSVAGGR